MTRIASVDTESDPSEETAVEVIAKINVAHEGVDIVRLLCKYIVVVVLGQLLGVGRVRGRLLHSRDEVLVEECLADMRGVDLVAERLIGKERGVCVHHDVDVGGTAGVVAREDGLELCNAIGVGLLDSSEEGVVEVRLVIRVAVAVRNDAGVDAGAVAVPDFDVHVGDGLACVDINDLVIEGDVDTWLRICNVLPNELAADIYTKLVNIMPDLRIGSRGALTVWSLSHLGSQQARRIAAEELRRVSIRRVGQARLIVRLGQDVLEILLREPPQSASLLDSRRAPGNASCLNATSTELLGAMREILSVDGVDKLPTLEDLFCEIMAGMSLGQAGDGSDGGDRGEAHVE